MGTGPEGMGMAEQNAHGGPRQVACVVIGRNEGPRLIESLRSVQAAGLRLVYVDSGSTDGSVEAAQNLGIRSLRLDSKQPYSAARARNRGLDDVTQAWPQTAYILFLDGDCTLEPAFAAVAVKLFGENNRCAIVTGHLSEQYPDRSIYNRLCSIEWRSPPGQMEGLNALGGIMMARVSALREVGGFNERAIAGEEADLAVRLRLAGYSILKADAPMATHDARILTFRQWWIRAVRGGYAFAHRYAKHGRTRFHDGRREVLSAVLWGILLPATVLLLLVPSRGLSVLLLGGYVVLGARIYRHYKRRGLSHSDALLSARFGLYAKFAHVVGILRFVRMGRQGSPIIEYK